MAAILSRPQCHVFISMNKNSQNWLLAWQHSRHPIGSQVRKALMINMDFILDVS